MLQKKKNKRTVAMAMSGGIDSCVAAFLLQKEYRVFGMTMLLGDFNKQAVKNAKKICKKLKIPHCTVDLQKEFKQIIIKPWCQQYFQAKTPNPCVWCNPKIKFGLLLKKARQLKADYLATGHYARVKKINKEYTLLKAKDKTRDQSYFLYGLKQNQLKYILFPLGGFKKDKIKQIAKNNRLVIRQQKESREICFIPDNDYRKFLKKNCFKIHKPGLIIDLQGNVVGKHQGLPFYTIGQRKGLIKGQKKPVYPVKSCKAGSPMAKFNRVYVIKIDKTKNTLIIGQEKDLYKKYLIAKNLNWVKKEKPKKMGEVIVKIRYRHKPAKARIVIDEAQPCQVGIEFKKAQRAITPGQSVVIYKGDKVLGGGVIER